jgi:hypothetical protein
VTISAHFGILGVDLKDVDLTLAPGVELRFDLQDPLTHTADTIRVPDLAGSISDLVTFQLASPGTQDVVFTAMLSAVAAIPGLDSFGLLDTNLTLIWADVSSNEYGLTVGDDDNGLSFLSFLKLDPQRLLDQSESLKQFLATASAAVQVNIPFVQQAFEELIRITEVFDTRVLDQLTLFGPGPGSLANFHTAQELLVGFASSLTDIRENAERPADVPDVVRSLADLPFSYDPTSGELTYELDADISFLDLSGETIDFAFDLGGLGDLSVSTEADFDLRAVVHFTVGIDLKDLTFDFESLAQNFFIRDVSLTAEAQFFVDAFDATARLGFLDVNTEGGKAYSFDPSADPSFDPSDLAQLANPRLTGRARPGRLVCTPEPKGF